MMLPNNAWNITKHIFSTFWSYLLCTQGSQTSAKNPNLRGEIVVKTQLAVNQIKNQIIFLFEFLNLMFFKDSGSKKSPIFIWQKIAMYGWMVSGYSCYYYALWPSKICLISNISKSVIFPNTHFYFFRFEHFPIYCIFSHWPWDQIKVDFFY